MFDYDSHDWQQYKKRIENVLRNSEYRKCDSKEYRESLLAELACPVSEIELFQYRPSSKECIEALRYGSVLFKSPLQFNDPFDSLMYWDEEQVRHYFRQEPYKAVLNNFAFFEPNAVARNISNCLRISCFSEVATSPLMWAHYADNATGYCACYKLHPSFLEVRCLKDASECNPGKWDGCKQGSCSNCCECSLFPVSYSCKRLDMTSSLQREIEYMTACELGRLRELDLSRYDSFEAYKVSLFKSADWFYEREWRLMLSGIGSGNMNMYTYPSDGLIGVILGTNIKPEDEYNVRKALLSYRESVRHDVFVKRVMADYQNNEYALTLVDDRL